MEEREELFLDDGYFEQDPVREFHAFYIVTKEDGSEPQEFNVTIKGEKPVPPSQIGFYTVLYSDGSIKTIDWLPGGVGWIERGLGKTAHSLSIGTLIEEYFGPNNN